MASSKRRIRRVIAGKSFEKKKKLALSLFKQGKITAAERNARIITARNRLKGLITAQQERREEQQQKRKERVRTLGRTVIGGAAGFLTGGLSGAVLGGAGGAGAQTAGGAVLGGLAGGQLASGQLPGSAGSQVFQTAATVAGGVAFKKRQKEFARTLEQQRIQSRTRFRDAMTNVKAQRKLFLESSGEAEELSKRETREELASRRGLVVTPFEKAQISRISRGFGRQRAAKELGFKTAEKSAEQQFELGGIQREQQKLQQPSFVELISGEAGQNSLNNLINTFSQVV